jgi:hypothetical protein
MIDGDREFRDRRLSSVGFRGFRGFSGVRA